MSLVKEAQYEYEMEKEALGFTPKFMGRGAAIGAGLGAVKGAFSKKVDPNTGQKQGLLKRMAGGAARGAAGGAALGAVGGITVKKQTADRMTARAGNLGRRVGQGASNLVNRAQKAFG